ncbi:hypothetical protein BDM02DRAFT_3115526 [Thelephora ganbajun]|uniref:Uncharacterized protein n=1 Tax=Thelephora ganbajun TaxID=370292 RepID=A0ACB6ZFM0_THEGA|nr:hypothetical protein BDM02DRAFT_3115526 [Thelephora ganbajun]
MAEPQPICPAVNAAMKQKRLSYQELADKLGQPEKAVVDLVTGSSPRIPGSTLQNVAEALGMKDSIPQDGKHGA